MNGSYGLFINEFHIFSPAAGYCRRFDFQQFSITPSDKIMQLYCLALSFIPNAIIFLKYYFRYRL